MADTKISALTDGAPALTGDILPVARSGANKRLTVSDILTAAVAHSGTTITATTGFVAPGNTGAGYGFSGSSSTLRQTAGNDSIYWTIGNATAVGQLISNGIRLGSAGVFIFTSDAAFASNDTSISRVSAGVLGVGTGAQGSVAGSLQALKIGIGQTVTKELEITANRANDDAPIVLTNNGNADFMQGIKVVAPNLTSVHITGYAVGQAFSAGNTSYLGFGWASSGSSSNFLTLGMHSKDDILKLYYSGGVQWTFFGAGALTTDASGNMTAVSDEREKKNIRPYTGGLELVLALNPIMHGYTKESGLDQTRNDYVGFGARAVEKVIPEAVGRMPDALDAKGKIIKEGAKTFNPFVVNAAMVNAIKELNTRIERLEKQ